MSEEIVASKNKAADVYDADSITDLDDMEAVRLRPGMYIDSVCRVGLHHLPWEIFDNSIDEALAGYCSEITITMHKDNSLSVLDNGRGIPVGRNSESGICAATMIFTRLHAGGKFGQGGYKMSGGLHGVGASVTNALSEWLKVQVARDGGVYQQIFERGTPVTEMERIAELEEEKTGTKVWFKPDHIIFTEAQEEEGGLSFDEKMISERLKLQSFLNKGLKIKLVDERGEGIVEREFFSENGLLDMISEDFENAGDEPAIESIQCEQEVKGIEVDLAFNFSQKFMGNTRSFVNNIWTKEGGNHERRFQEVIAKVLSGYGRDNMKMDTSFEVADIKGLIMAVVSIRIEDPKFVGQTKQKLSSKEAGQAVAKVTEDFFGTYLDENPLTAEALVKKAETARKARLSAEKALLRVKRDDGMNMLGTLPGKLADCQSKNRDETELFIVEGDSAGGSAKQARERFNQAVMPLRGKIVNVNKTSEDDVFEKSEQIQNLRAALGCWDEKGVNLEKLRYGKIVILCDADVDGAHISVLLMTFLVKFGKELIQNGHLYVAVPPLYKMSKNNGETLYFANDDVLNERFPTPESLRGWDKQRFKGLGEMNPSQLSETAMAPETRSLLQVSMPEGTESEVEDVFEVLMGKDVEPRKAFLEAQNCFTMKGAAA